MLGVAEIALLAPWLFWGIIKIGTTRIWHSPQEARRQATQITRVILYTSMIVLPVAAAAYGAMASRRRILKGALGLVVGAALWVGNLSCFGYMLDSEA
jgi:cytochrome b561